MLLLPATVVVSEAQLLLDEPHPDAFGGEDAYDRAQGVKVGCGTVYAVHNHGVAVAHEPDHGLEL